MIRAVENQILFAIKFLKTYINTVCIYAIISQELPMNDVFFYTGKLRKGIPGFVWMHIPQIEENKPGLNLHGIREATLA